MSHKICTGLFIAFLAGMLTATPTVRAQTTWHVDDDAPGDPGPGDPAVSDPLEDGSADHPFDAIQEGIDVASDGDTVLVADGTYTGVGNKNLEYGGKAITVQSETRAYNCVIDCEGAGRGFRFSNDETTEAVLNGFTITNGHLRKGAGILCRAADPTILNCIIINNQAYEEQGGGILCVGASPIIANCAIVGNAAYLEGGAIACLEDSAPTVLCCTVTGNTASMACGGILSAPDTQITNCILWGNVPDQISGDGAVTYCDVQRGWSGEGNIDTVPAFADPDNGDYRLTAESHCINVGNNAAAHLPTNDFEGDVRVQHCRVDLGFDETPYFFDCNMNGVPDACDIADGTSEDCTGNVIPDECEPDCNGNGVADSCDIADGTSEDCGDNGIPDECEPDCNDNGMADDCDIVDGISKDCNANGVPDECDIADGTSEDCDADGVPDECQDTTVDCNANGIWDALDIAAGTSSDCNLNSIPDECDIADGASQDADDNGIPDECEDGSLIIVDDDALNDPGPGDPAVSDPLEDGSVEHPFDAIQEAINAAVDGHVVVVLNGTYTGVGNKNLDFGGKAITVHSAAGPANCIIDCEYDGRGFCFQSGESTETFLVGLTVMNGSAEFGGGVYCDSSDPVIKRCIIAANEANNGAGVYCQMSAAVIAGCLIVGNTAQAEGGGVLCEQSTTTIAACTVVANVAGLGGGGVQVAGSSNARITSCVLFDNDAPEGPALRLLGFVNPSTLSIAYSDIHGGQSAMYVWPACTLVWENTTIEVHPLLADPAGPDGNAFTWQDNDYHLTERSPCVNAGDNYVPGVLRRDFDGGLRIQHCRADIGVDESPYVSDQIPDCNGNGQNDDCEVQDGLAVDCNQNHVPDECDLANGTSEDRNANGIPDECEEPEDVPWHVDDDAPNDPGPGDPSISDPEEDGSAAHPFDSIQEAIDVALDQGVVLVADGTYVGIGNRDLDFLGKPITVHSDCGPGTCIIDCEHAGRGFYFRTDETAQSVLHGITITNGSAIMGGGVCCRGGASPSISDCVITGNLATGGGGLGGGGVYCATGSAPTITNCSVIANESAGGGGGGVHCDEGGNASIRDCFISHNAASGQGSGVFCDWSNVTVVNCIIVENAGGTGAGISCARADATLVNCTITRNTAQNSGGGIGCFDSSDPVIANCAIVGNTAGSNGGGLTCSGGAPLVVTTPSNKYMTSS